MPIFYTDLYANSSSGAVTMVGANAAANADGVAGLVPAPLVSNATQFLRGDGIWAEAGGGGSSTVMVGATGSSNGISGLVPAPASGDITLFLRGDGYWAPAALPMIGADGEFGFSGRAGLVPAPLASNATQFLRGDGIWSGPSPIPDTTGGTALSFSSVYHKRTVSSAQSFTFSDIVDGAFQSLTLELRMAAGGSVTWPAEVKWPNSTAPTLATGKTHMVVFTASNASSIFAASIVNYPTVA